MQNKALSLSVIAVTTVVTMALASSAFAEADKITICHGAGQEGTTHFVTLTLSRNAVYQDQGEGGHFFENGTPKAGHEQDYLGECNSPASSAEPTPTPSSDPTPTPSADPTATPTPTPTSEATPTPAPNTGGSSSTNSDSSNSNSGDVQGAATEKSGQILGAYAATGVVEDTIMNLLGYLGGTMTAVGSALYGKKRSR